MNIDLKKIKKVHIIGIEGAGTSALARMCKDMGIKVSGSDEGDHFYFATLDKVGIKVNHEFRIENIPKDTNLIVYSTAFKPETNDELRGAFESGINIVSYPEFLGMLFNQKIGIAVCGTHGKTTTSALLGFVLRECGVDPSVIVGSNVPQLGGGSLVGKSDYFVIEADEFQNKLKYYNPFSVILTSVDWDHPDFYPTFAQYKKAFTDFVAKIPKIGTLAVWGDSADTLEIAKSATCDVISYGFNDENDVVIKKAKAGAFEIMFRGKYLGVFKTQLVGDHNMLNAASVIATCFKLNVDLEKMREALAGFRGTTRRFEIIGERNGSLLVDDYGHHPEEIKATLKAARELYPEKNIITVFHPHSYSRTESLLEDFAQAFDDSNNVFVLDIYGSAREFSGKVSSRDLVDLINKYNPGKAEHVPTIPEAISMLQNKIGSEDVVISMGAGNVWEVTHKLKES